MSDYKNFNPIQFDDERNVRSKIAFSVTGAVNITPYMEDGKTVEKTHIVYAIDEDDAERKFTEFYNNKTSEYSIYYNVYSVKVNETII